ncbi:unnamed protein product (mitochondrion) [Plasmodiophora brassicae]|uniref:Metallo-beta-lactamase domain-containing protein n=1 Tax=Plasmodiophora brassicae TaxID=37360 RepID=A0A3P3YI55_PLABS|nr:unnamed protein product [Plasmodiophora brassicae]
MTPPSLRRVASADPASPAAHHVASGGFCNPWPSFRFSAGFRKFAKLMLGADWKRATPPPPAELVKVVAPDWARISADKPATMLLTWMGHAAMLLSLPSGQRILFDPCWSDRCSPVQFAGPRRYTPPPCPLADLPPIDAVVISHNHYDHLDLNTIKDLAARNPDAIFFAPLGNAAWFRSVAVPNAVECDWWDEYEVGGSDLHIACTPCQHFTGRSLTDRFQTLWSSWVVTCGASKFYFAGDTGYRTVLEDEDEDAVPTCPVFKQIGERYGPFDLAAIPIGAYSPR